VITNTNAANSIESRLWAAADQLWANSSLKPSEYSSPVLGLIFLRYADHKFTQAEAEFAKSSATVTSRHKIGKIDYQAKGVLYLPQDSRFSRLRNIPEGEDLGKAVNDGMKLIEIENEELRKACSENRRHDLQAKPVRRDGNGIPSTLVQRVVNGPNIPLGNCEVCGREIIDAGRYSWVVHPYTCGRCGKFVCYSCGGHSPGYGYGEEDKARYRDVCIECYWDLQETYARTWESEFGDDTTAENPYELTEGDRELRERLRTNRAERE